MFDRTTHTHTTIEAPMDAVLAKPPVRIELGTDVHWLRPSNVVRLEATTSGGHPQYLYIWLTSGQKLWLNANSMTLEQLHSLADEVASKLWGSEG